MHEELPIHTAASSGDDRNRTCTPVKELDPKSSASASSATSPKCCRSMIYELQASCRLLIEFEIIHYIGDNGTLRDCGGSFKVGRPTKPFDPSTETDFARDNRSLDWSQSRNSCTHPAQVASSPRSRRTGRAGQQQSSAHPAQGLLEQTKAA